MFHATKSRHIVSDVDFVRLVEAVFAPSDETELKTYSSPWVHLKERIMLVLMPNDHVEVKPFLLDMSIDPPPDNRE